MMLYVDEGDIRATATAAAMWVCSSVRERSAACTRGLDVRMRAPSAAMAPPSCAASRIPARSPQTIAGAAPRLAHRPPSSLSRGEVGVLVAPGKPHFARGHKYPPVGVVDTQLKLLSPARQICPPFIVHLCWAEVRLIACSAIRAVPSPSPSAVMHTKGIHIALPGRGAHGESAD